jgi:hypothetical protein
VRAARFVALAALVAEGGFQHMSEVDAVQQWMTLQLWMALGLDSQAFDGYINEHGWADTWSNLLGVVRGLRTPCAEPIGGDDYCVFAQGHSGPHYGASDVGPPNDLMALYASVSDTSTNEGT